MAYSFQEQLALGMEQEARLDEHFGSRFSIREATRNEQRAGIDRWFDDGRSVFSVEYKADFKSADTGNAFIETVSVGKWNDGQFVVDKHGWAVTSEADWLVYLVVGPDDMYIVKPGTIKVNLPRWNEQFRVVGARNYGYSSQGILVPLDELDRVSVAKRVLTTGD